MRSHQLRLQLLVALTIAFAIGALSLFLAGAWSDAASGVFGTALGILVPACIDALKVDRRRRDPAARAVVDEVVAPVVDKP